MINKKNQKLQQVKEKAISKQKPNISQQMEERSKIKHKMMAARIDQMFITVINEINEGMTYMPLFSIESRRIKLES